MEVSDCLANAQLIRQKLIEPFNLLEQWLLALSEQQQLVARLKEERAEGEAAILQLEQKAIEIDEQISRAVRVREAEVLQTSQQRVTLQAAIQKELEQAKFDRRVIAQTIEQDRQTIEAFRAEHAAKRATLEAEFSALRDALADMQQKRLQFLASIGAS